MNNHRAKRIKNWLYSTLMIAYLSLAVVNARVVELTPGVGGIDWSESVIRVSGIGHATPYTPPGRRIENAKKNARGDLKKNLLNLLKKIRWDAENLVSDITKPDPRIDSSIVDISDKISIIDVRYIDNGNIEMDAQMQLKYAFQWYPPAISDSQLHKHPPDSTRRAADDMLISEINWEGYGGIIIDARQLGANPALFPKIMDETGNILYDVTMVKREFLYQYGMVGYADTPAAAKNQKRISGKSLLIRAKSATGKYVADLVVGSAGARKIRAASQSSSLLREGKVVIIIE